MVLLVEYPKENYYAMILATIGIKKDTFVFYSTWNSVKVNRAYNVGQGYRVMVRACRVYQ